MDELKTMELLDKYLEGSLDDGAKMDLERKLMSDIELREQLEILKFTRKEIKEIGIRKEILNVHKEFMANRGEGKQSKVVSLFENRWVRVAASLLLIFTIISIFLSQIQTSKVIDENYLTYHLPVLRTEAPEITEGELLFQEGNWKGYLQWVDETDVTEQKTYFLAGLAAYESASFDDALVFFQKVREMNISSGKPLFEQETDYYATLAYLQKSSFEEAIVLINKMRDDPSHSYHDVFGSWDLIKIKALKWKKDS